MAAPTVVKVEPPEGDPLRRWSASGALTRARPRRRAVQLSRVFEAQRRRRSGRRTTTSNSSAPCSPTRTRWYGRAGSKVAEHRAFTPDEIHRVHPHLTVTAITPFGLEGPWRDKPATEFTLQAWSGGIVGLGRGSPDRAPVFVGGQVGEYLAGAYASAATLASRMRTLDTGRGDLIDLSMLETQIMGLTYYPVTYFEMLGRPWRDARRLTVPGSRSAKDGLVDIGCGTAQQWFDLCAMIGHPRVDRRGVAAVDHRAGQREGRRDLRMGQEPDRRRHPRARNRFPDSRTLRSPTAPMSPGWTTSWRAGRLCRTRAMDYLQPTHPYRMQPALLRAPSPAPRLGEHTERYRRDCSHGRKSARSTARPAISAELPLSGIRVLDMTTFWAGPSCTHPLALLGADVIHVESTRRPDGTRLIAGVPVTEEQWWEKSPIFSSLNTNKKGLTLDLQNPRGQDLMRRLIATCDVIVENFTPRVLDQIGLDFAAVQALRPDAILLRMPGFGLDGPWRDNPAFAYAIEAAAGLSWLTGYPDRNPYEPYSIGDPNAGVHALNGLLLALEHRRRTGEGVLRGSGDGRRSTQCCGRTSH